MTLKQVVVAWAVFPKLGKLSFLLKSTYMKEAYPTENDAFFAALDRLPNLDFADLPGELQDEFRAFVDTPSYGMWMRKKGGEVR